MPSVVIDCGPESALRYQKGFAVVAVDVIRATTTITTAVSLGRRCFPVASTQGAFQMATRLENPLLAGELGGNIPPGFEINNSPTILSQRSDISRPLILLSSSGTKLIRRANGSDAVFLACLRNFIPVAREIAGNYENVAVLGAGSRNQFREEDQICCAWLTGLLLDQGFKAVNSSTVQIVKRWPIGRLDGIAQGASARYLAKSGQTYDLEFVLSHVSDLNHAYVLNDSEVFESGATPFPGVSLQDTNYPAPEQLQ
jgi:2-phosphosulfolactate phosphatase